MVDDRISDGRRVAALLASELEGRADDGLEAVVVENADRDVEPTPEGARAYDVVRDGTLLACAYVLESGLRLEFEGDDEVVADAAADSGLAVSEFDGAPAVTVPDAASVKRAVSVVQAVVAATNE